MQMNIISNFVTFCCCAAEHHVESVTLGRKTITRHDSMNTRTDLELMVLLAIVPAAKGRELKMLKVNSFIGFAAPPQNTYV